MSQTVCHLLCGIGLAIFLVWKGRRGWRGYKVLSLSFFYYYYYFFYPLRVFSHYSKKHQFAPPTFHATQMVERKAHLRAQKAATTSEKSSKVWLKSCQSGQKHSREQMHHLFNLGCYAQKNDIPSLLIHTLYKQHNVTHSYNERANQTEALLYK